MARRARDYVIGQLDLGGEPAETAAAVPMPAPAAAPAEDENVKIVGPLRIGIPLFNIYLNEADELSRRLVTELAEWGVEPHRHPVDEECVVLEGRLQVGTQVEIGPGGVQHPAHRHAAGGDLGAECPTDRSDFGASDRDATIRIALTAKSNLPSARVADFPGNFVSSNDFDNGDVWFNSTDYNAPVS